MMAGDYVRLYRKSLDSAVFQDPWLWKLWSWCLLKACWKKRWKDGRVLLPGQFALGRIEAADQLSASPSKVYRGLHKLQEWGQIKLEVNSKGTVVTVCNWKSYQNKNSENCEKWTADEQPVNSRWTADEQPVNSGGIVQDSDEEGEEGEEGNLPRADKPPRKRDLLFDAIAEITASDVQLNGSHIGKVAEQLRKVVPPYTAEDVLRLPQAITDAGMSFTLTVGSIPKHIGLVRRHPVTVNGKDLYEGIRRFAANGAANGTLDKEHGA